MNIRDVEVEESKQLIDTVGKDVNEGFELVCRTFTSIGFNVTIGSLIRSVDKRFSEWSLGLFYCIS